MLAVIDENECPECHCTDTKVTDTSYNRETRKCNECKAEYEVKFKLFAYNAKLIKHY